MTSRTLRLTASLALALLVGCPLPEGSSYGKPCADDDGCADGYRCSDQVCVPVSFVTPERDAGSVDAGFDAGRVDDAGEPPVDAGPTDAGGADAGDGDAGDGDAGDGDAGDGELDGGGPDDAGSDAGTPPDFWCVPANVVDIDLSQQASYQGDTRLGVDLVSGSCQAGGAPEQVLRFTPTTVGTLHFELLSDLDLGVVVLDGCDIDSASETKCVEVQRPGIVERGTIYLDSLEPVYLVIDGFGEGDEAPWTLTLDFVEPFCGNQHADPDETCDVQEPWCVQCLVQASESEPGNDAATGAQQIPSGVARAAIDPAGDVDVFEVNVPDAGSSLTAHVTDTFGGSACRDFEIIDAEVSILDQNGLTVLSAADLGLVSGCPTARVGGLASGVYYVRVRQSRNVSTSQATLRFSYQLQVDVKVPVCGDAELDYGEHCDYVDPLAAPFCTSTCTFSTTAEVEPNHEGAIETGAVPRNRGNDFGTTNVGGPYLFDVVIAGALSPAGDEDVYLVRNDGSSSTTGIIARIMTAEGPYGACEPSVFDPLLHVVDGDGGIVATGDTPTGMACDEVVFDLPAGGGYYLHVHDYGDDTVVPPYLLQIDFP